MYSAQWHASSVKQETVDDCCVWAGVAEVEGVCVWSPSVDDHTRGIKLLGDHHDARMNAMVL
jgi:hypothetical protein